MAQYLHLGVPVTKPQPNETYSPEMKLFLTELAQCEKIVLPITEIDEHTKIAFAWRDGVLFELMECC